MSLLVKRNGNGLVRPFRSLMSDFFDDSFFEGEFSPKASLPSVNVKENEGNFQIEVAAPEIEVIKSSPVSFIRFLLYF